MHFQISPSKIQILSTPSEFQTTLIQLIKSSHRRISLASLYIQDQRLVDALKERLRECREVECVVLVDYLRGTRGHQASLLPSSSRSSSNRGGSINHTDNTTILSTLISLKSEFPDQIKIGFHKSPMFRGLWKLMPERVNEGCGVMHVKCYVFDDRVVLGG